MGALSRALSRGSLRAATSGGLRCGLWTLLAWALPLCVPALAQAQAQVDDAVVRLETRPGVLMPVYLMRRPGAVALVLLLSGGRGGMGRLDDGQPTSRNFLVRSREFFAQAGFDVAVLGLPADKKEGWSAQDRLGAEHLEDLRSVVRRLKAASGLPVWLVGTSMGTVSATAAAIAFGQQELAGVVLTSSITGRQKLGAVPTQDLAAIRIPVLVLHHARDGCTFCSPAEAANIPQWLTGAPVRRFILAEGGGGATGDPCEALHHHGFIGMEQEAVRLIADWIRHPVP